MENKTHNFIAYIQNRADSNDRFGVTKELVTITQEEINEIIEDEGYTEEEAIARYLMDVRDEIEQGFRNVLFEKIN
jgi:hypothetical protein